MSILTHKSQVPVVGVQGRMVKILQRIITTDFYPI